MNERVTGAENDGRVRQLNWECHNVTSWSMNEDLILKVAPVSLRDRI
jgi:hypothetical protein